MLNLGSKGSSYFGQNAYSPRLSICLLYQFRGCRVRRIVGHGNGKQVDT